MTAVVALGALGLACGDDDDGGDAAAETVESETVDTDAGGPSEETPASGGSTEALCAAVAKIDAPFDEAGQYASREQKQAAALAVVDGGSLDEAAAAAPAELARAVETRGAAIRSAAEGMTEALISTEAIEAADAIAGACTGGTGGY
jgi:hypothetical protein